MNKIIIALLLLSPAVGFTQAGSEIYLFDLKEKKGELVLSDGQNITNHKGYDNQPSFHPDEPLIYYSSFNDEGRADIKSFNYKTGVTATITTTNEREYSPTVTLDKQYLSCIIQRDNNEQNLGKYPIKGGEPIVLINDLIVGYHVWVNPEQLMLFALGTPNTLQLYNLNTKEHDVIESSIGRSLHKIPGENAVSYVLKKSDTDWIIRKYEPVAKATSDIIATLPGSEDLCWTPKGKILMSSDTKIYVFDPQGSEEWKSVALPAPFTTKVSRLAVSKDGKKIAVVVSE